MRTVLVERLDCVARDLMVQESVIAGFQHKNLTIAKRLNAEGLKPRTAGSRWHQTSVYRILKTANAL